MAQWDDGYVTDVAYTTNFYREITPPWLGMTSLLLGHRAPDLTRPFRYADLGCGNGFTTLTVAATCPQAEVWGFDFNPAHIEFASDLASRAGLTNVHFTETSFAELAGLADAALPDFDFMVSHGVLSWISPANRQHLMSVIGQRLKPGGLVYLSYNVTSGWAAMVPVRALMRMLTAANPERTDLAVPVVLDFMDRLKQADAAFFQQNPSVEARLQEVRKQDHRYIAHEFLNQDWHPLDFTTIAGEMAEAKCRYIGSAALAENIEAISAPPAMIPILAEARDPYLRETLRDFGCGQTFRRDVFRKGSMPISISQQHALLDSLTLAALAQSFPEGGPVFPTPRGNVTGRPEIYQPLLDMLMSGPVSIRQARTSPAFAERGLLEVIQAFTLMASGAYAHPLLPDGGTAAGREASHRLNRAIAAVNGESSDLPRLVAPVIGSAIGVDLLETLLVGALLSGRPAEVDPLADDLLGVLGGTGRSVQREGKPVTDPAEARQILVNAIRGILDRRVPFLRSLGVLE